MLLRAPEPKHKVEEVEIVRRAYAGGGKDVPLSVTVSMLKKTKKTRGS